MPAPLPVIVAVVSAVFQVMLNVEGMRMRMSFAALMVGVAASLTVIGLIAVGGCPTPNVWFAAEAMVCAAAGDRDAATPRQARRRTPGSRIWIFMVPPAGARAVPGDTERMAINRNELAAAIVVARPHSARFGYRRGNLGARC